MLRGHDSTVTCIVANLTFVYSGGADKAIIISTHILEEVPAVCSRAIVIARGRLLFDGSPRELAELAPERQIEAAFRRGITDPYAPSPKASRNL